jgi:single-strand DNA-binding protein
VTTQIGNLTQPVELRFTNSGRAVCSNRLAVNRRWQVNGEWQEQTTYIPITMWGPLAENFAASCEKGTRVWVTGHFEPEEYENADRKVHSLKLIAYDAGISLQKARATVERVVTSKPVVPDESDVF